MTTVLPPDAENLYEHAAYLRQLARDLAGSGDSADDLVQDAYVVALERPPRERSSLRAWFATVVRNLASNKRRREHRRRRREIVAARDETQTQFETAGERLELLREVFEQVFTLREPYRTTIYLRYYEGLMPVAIAERLDVPVKTVKTRLTRGLEKLRRRLDERLGERRHWTFGLLAYVDAKSPMAGSSVAVVGVIGGGLILKKLIAVVVVIIAGAFAWREFRTERPNSLTDGAPRLGQVSSVTPVASGVDALPLAQPLAAETRSAQIFDVDRDLDLHGRVLLADRTVVAGARIEIREHEKRGVNVFDGTSDLSAEFVATTTSNDRGEFRIALERGVPYYFEASDGVHADAALSSRYAGECVEIVLRDGATLIGRVTRKTDGAVMAGAQVSVERDVGTMAPIVETDHNGEFRVEGLEAAKVVVTVKPLAGVAVSESVELVAGEETRRNFVVEDGLRFLGRVTDRATGFPIAGASVYSDKVPMFRNKRVITDRDGRYEIQGVDHFYACVLKATATGFAASYIPVQNQRELVQNADFALARGYTVTGRVLDEARKPAADSHVSATIQLMRSGRSDEDWSTTVVDEFGAFTLGPFAHDSALEVVIRAPDHATLMLRIPPPTADVSTHALGDFHLQGAAAVFGCCRNFEGVAQPDVRVYLDKMSFDNSPDQGDSPRRVIPSASTYARTDDLGRYSFTDLGPGLYKAYAQRTSEWQSVDIELDVGEQRADVDFVFGKRGALSIRGRVVDPNGLGVAHVRLDLSTPGGASRSGMADASGNFAITSLEIATYEIEVRIHSDLQDHLSPKRFSGIDAGAQDVVLVLDAAVFIEGVVLNHDGSPAHLAVVTAYDSAGKYEDNTRSDRDGSFRINLRADEPYRVTAGPALPDPTYSKPSRQVEIDDLKVSVIDAWAGPRRYELRLPASRTIRGRVEKRAGVGVANISVVAYYSDDAALSQSATDAQGNFTLIVRPSGPCAIAAALEPGDCFSSIARPTAQNSVSLDNVEAGTEGLVLRIP